MPLPQGGVWNIVVYQGASWTETYSLLKPDGVTPEPLTGYVGKAQIRAAPGAPGAPLAEFGVVVDGPAGKVTLTLTAAQTAALEDSGVWDLFLTSAAETILLLQGAVVVDKRVTVT